MVLHSKPFSKLARSSPERLDMQRKNGKQKLDVLSCALESWLCVLIRSGHDRMSRCGVKGGRSTNVHNDSLRESRSSRSAVRTLWRSAASVLADLALRSSRINITNRQHSNTLASASSIGLQKWDGQFQTIRIVGCSFSRRTQPHLRSRPLHTRRVLFPLPLLPHSPPLLSSSPPSTQPSLCPPWLSTHSLHAISTITGLLIKISLDAHPTSTLASNSINDVPAPRVHHYRDTDTGVEATKGIEDKSLCEHAEKPSLATREQTSSWTKTMEIDDEEYDLLLVCAEMSETDESMLTVDGMILASEYSPDQNFVFATPFSFAVSIFSKHPSTSSLPLSYVWTRPRLIRHQVRIGASECTESIRRCIFEGHSALSPFSFSSHLRQPFFLASLIVLVLIISLHGQEDWNTITSIGLSLKGWKAQDPEVLQSGKRIVQALLSEDLEDTLDQTLMDGEDRLSHRYIVDVCHSVFMFLGANESEPPYPHPPFWT
ncbi:hypothetical protein BLNAU_8923 [Blattamonas nauphoetae]|uniref:Uncharacterized protein n=1 Tax=Blattamonas nauphoetae TaxID=2049346 RepID=A0ABQ9XXE2_9EUKA|nr:hypothetical protein BLNAU_8923 [Blattamonas nauphoetae]